MDFTTQMAERAALALRMIVPYSLILLLIVMNVISAPAPLLFLFKTPFFLMVLYYWTIYRPTILPVWAVFIIGLFIDILGYFPLGLNALLFIACRLFIFDQRKYLLAQSFQMNWLGFMFMNVSYHLILWCSYSLVNWTLMPAGEIWMSLILGGLFYPLIFMLLHLTHKALPVSVAKNSKTLISQRKRMPL